KHRGAETQEEVQLPYVSSSPKIDIKIDSPALPTEAVVTLFGASDLDTQGIPMPGTGKSLDCLDVIVNQCRTVENSASLDFDLRPNPDTKIIVLHLTYLLVDNDVDPPEGHHMVGSWGFRVK
ncbi:MAG: hypothetical protein ACLGH7_05005, partial [Actinomycetes bacterium]